MCVLERLRTGEQSHVAAVCAAAGLTPREQEVAWLALGGESASELGRRSGIAVNTVKVHLRRVYAKLGVVGRTDLQALLMGTRTR